MKTAMMGVGKSGVGAKGEISGGPADTSKATCSQPHEHLLD